MRPECSELQQARLDVIKAEMSVCRFLVKIKKNFLGITKLQKECLKD